MNVIATVNVNWCFSLKILEVVNLLIGFHQHCSQLACYLVLIYVGIMKYS